MQRSVQRDVTGSGASDSDPFVPGTSVGPYHVLREIGRGGMGRVLLARDASTGDRLVALKVLLAETAHRPLLEARFAREVRNLARLRHPGIVTIFSAGSFAGHPFLVMDHLAGRDLREFLFEGASLPGPQRVARVVCVMAQVARAIAHAHANGVAHRDIKPSNIRVRAGNDEAVLLDFGISKCLDDLGLTGVEVPGTALYMAPEQLDLRRHAGDHLIDVWALGVTLYVALTSELPFKGDSVLALSHDVVFSEPEPPTLLNGRISRELEAIVLGCMRKDARERIQSAGEVAELLEAMLATPAVAAVPFLATATAARAMSSLPPSRGGAADAPTALAATEVAAVLARVAPPAPRRRAAGVARVLTALVCLGAVLLTSDMRVVAAGGTRGDDDRTVVAEDPGMLAGRRSIARDPQLGRLLAEDEAMARSVLLYTTDVDVASRRNLMSALHALSEDRTLDALPRLREFARGNAKSPLLALARFWIGTALFATGDLDEAAREYDAIVASGRHSRFAPRALLFQAAAHTALGDRGTRDRLLAQLVAEYPESPAARAAGEPLPLPLPLS